MNKKNFNSFVITALLCILYMLTLQFIYVNYIAKSYGYSGFESNFSLVRYVISWILFVPVPIFLNKYRDRENFSILFLGLLLFYNYIPMLVMYTYKPAKFMPLFVLYYVVMFLAVMTIPEIRLRIGNSSTGQSIRGENVVNAIGIILAALAIFVWIFYARLNIEIGFSDVYEIRMAARTYSMPTPVFYMFSMAKGIIPLLLIYNLYAGKKIKAVFFALIQIILFFCDGSKVTFFLLIAGLGAYFIVRKRKKLLSFLPIIFMGVSLLAILEALIFGTINVTAIVIRRSFFIPCNLNYNYFDFISKNGIDFFRQSLNLLGNSRYSTTIAYLIGGTYYNSSSMSANNGLFSDAYANLGIAGMIVMPILIILVIKLLEGAGRNIPKEVWAVCLIRALLGFVSSSFFTVLMTHGMAALIIILYIIPEAGSLHKAKLKYTVKIKRSRQLLMTDILNNIQ